MKNYLKYKDEIGGFTDVLETVKTVEKIAASSIHTLKAQVKILGEYKTELSSILKRLLLYTGDTAHPLLQKKTAGKKALLVIGGEKGLVGPLHRQLVSTCMANAGDYDLFYALGKKIAGLLTEEGLEIKQKFGHESELPTSQDVETCTNYFFDAFKKGEFVKLDIIFPSFVSLSVQETISIQFLPFTFNVKKLDGAEAGSEKAAPEEPEKPEGLPIFEPDAGQIFRWLLERYIGIFFHEIIMEAKLSELAARTVSMENASGKARQFIRKLKLVFLKERKKAATQKQLESFIVHKLA